MTLRSQQTIEPANLKLALLFYPLFNGLFARGNDLSCLRRVSNVLNNWPISSLIELDGAGY